MPENAYTVTVAKDLEDLIPEFVENRRRELESLRAALAAGAFERLQQLGHRMRGVGNSFGFERVSSLGGQIEEGATRANRGEIEARIAEYADYLSRVKIVYE